MESQVNILSVRCKCCFDEGQLTELWAEYLCNGERENYGEMLTECFAIPWDPPADYAEQICWACIEKVRDAYFFKKKVLETQSILQEITGKNVIKDEVQGSLLKSETSEKLDATIQNLLIEAERTESQDGNVEMEYIEEYEEVAKDQLQLPVGYEVPVTDNSTSINEAEEFYEVEYLEEDQNGQLVREAAQNLAPKTTTTSTTTTNNNNKRKRDSYRKYSESELQKCLEAVKSNAMTRMEASAVFGVPVKTISSKLRAEAALGDKSGDEATEDTAKNVETDVERTAVEKKPLQYAKPIINHGKMTESSKLYSNLQAILLNSNATPIRGYWGIGFGCVYCKNQYPKALDLKQHTLTTHNDVIGRFMAGKSANEFIVKLDVSGLKCDLCQKEISTFESLMEHLENEHNVTVYKDVNNHILPFSFSKDNDGLKCVVCGVEFNYFKSLSEHVNDHYRNYECQQCGRGFINKSSFRVHSYRHKYGEFPCAYCTKSFDTKVKKREHERVVHLLRSKAHRCSYCDERFGDSRAKNKHESIVHGASPKVFTCNACESIFYRQKALTEHINEFHLQIKPFSCYSCDKPFAKRKDFEKHVVVHTSNDSNTQNQCGVCSKIFKTAEFLEQHMRLHAEEKRYPCPYCESTFVQKINLINHLKFQHKESVDDVCYETEISEISENFVMKLMDEEL